MVYRGSVYDSDYIARLQLDILCPDERADEVVDVIMKAGRTGEVGDGKITVLDAVHCVRIRTGETGPEAV
jgi:nitrogen regulatory protein PII